MRKRDTPQKRVSLKIIAASVSRVEGQQVDRREITTYWGYTVEVSGTGALLADSAFPLKVATSRHGDPVTRVAQGLANRPPRLEGRHAPLRLPLEGPLRVHREGFEDQVNYVVNLFPEQNVVTARSEEAILTGLYLVGLLSSPELPPFV